MKNENIRMERDTIPGEINSFQYSSLFLTRVFYIYLFTESIVIETRRILVHKKSFKSLLFFFFFKDK